MMKLAERVKCSKCNMEAPMDEGFMIIEVETASMAWLCLACVVVLLTGLTIGEELHAILISPIKAIKLSGGDGDGVGGDLLYDHDKVGD